MADNELNTLREIIEALEEKVALQRGETEEKKQLRALLEAEVDIEKEKLSLKKKQSFYTTEEFKLEFKIKDAIKNRLLSGKTFLTNQKEIKKLLEEQEKINDKIKNSAGVEKELWEKKLEASKQNYISLEATNKMIGKTVPLLTKWGGSFTIISSGVSGIGDGFGVIFKLGKEIFSYVSKIWNDFDKVDSAVRDISVNMGLTSSQMATFSRNTAYAAVETAKLGIGIEEVIKLQQTMGEGLGRNLILTREQIKGVAEMAKGSNLGVEGVSTMAEAFDDFGINLNTMRDRVDNVFKSTQKLGLNSSKVFKLISDNLKTAQKYSFKEGTKGLELMAKRAASIKLDLGNVFGLAEKLFELEGAVDLSAQLQVLGGSFASLGDPMQLIFQARNDVNGLTESLIEATKGVAMFDKATGEFKIPAMELHRLRKVADATGISLENLTQPALQLAKQEKAISQLANAFSYDKEQRQAIANLAQMSQNGVFEIITSDGTKKALSSLNPNEINKILGKSSSLEQAAKSRMTFLDMLKNIGNVFTSKLFPVLENISKKLMEGGLINKLQSLADKIGGFLNDLFTSDKVDKMIESAKTFIDKIMGIVNNVLSGDGSFTQKIISVGAQLIGSMFKEAINMFIKPLIGGGIGALLGGSLGGMLGGPAGVMLGAKFGGMLGTLGGVAMINDGKVLPNSKVISQVTPNGTLKPLAITNPKDTITASKTGSGGNLNINLSGTLKLDLGMGVSLDMRRDLIENPDFRYSILQLVSNNMLELNNGTV